MATSDTVTRPAVRVNRPSGRGRRATALTVGAILALMTIFPLLWMVTSSFKGADEVLSTNLLPHKATLSNYTYVFTQVPFARYLLNSLIVSVVVTVVALWFHSMAAYALARLRFPGRDTLFLLIFSTLLVTAPVILVPLFLIVHTLGLLDTYAGLIIPAIFNAFGIFLLRQFYLSIPSELEDAAIVDGCSYWQIYWRVILPLSKPVFAALAVLFFLANWNAFLWPLIATNSQDLNVVQLGIASFQQEHANNWNYTLAASTIAAIPTLGLFALFQRRIVESIKTSGFK
ncbi:carbohydrate ABC transporter permease [Actinocatenispora rupis]|uniref:sn-glycerol-3-phosphate transport system permease protein UgpE n=1 Tax=Actinocatenispora rupis TaxID=519421 RepID=A0A8J3NAN7_9ACTN|nr:carbohydrate ABC transporter permease [Actinocatenispora rupis]GID09757.1 sn-glycerol-3-phosphate transport system permease protein UgpE [Actinocatenispora rupis]